MLELTNNEKLLLLNKLIEEANKNRKWVVEEEECDRWCVYDKDNYVLYKWPVIDIENCLEFKGYKYLLERIDRETGDTDFIVAKFVTPRGNERYFFTEDQYHEFEI